MKTAVVGAVEADGSEAYLNAPGTLSPQNTKPLERCAPGTLCPQNSKPLERYAFRTLCPRNTMPPEHYAPETLCLRNTMPQGHYAPGKIWKKMGPVCGPRSDSPLEVHHEPPFVLAHRTPS